MNNSTFKWDRYTVLHSKINDEWQIFYTEPKSDELELIADGFEERALAVAYLLHNE